jgi:CubicO group peptidase (beta-lactamase class C family)
MIKLLLLSNFFVFTFTLSKAQSIDSAVKHAANNFMANGPRVGFSIGIVKDGSTFKYNFGVVHKDKTNTPTEHTIYEIGSVTKTFTSLLLAEAVKENKVKLSDDIRKFLHGSYPNLQFHGKPIQILYLANLTSGLPNNLPEKMPEMKSLKPDSQMYEVRNFHDGYSKTQFLKDLHNVKLTEEPGLNPAHSNTAAELLAFILEDIYGRNYEQLLIKYITGPLKMENTFVVLPPSKKYYYASGYNDKGVLMPDIPKDAGGAGILKSSLNDMIKYTNYQLQEKNINVKLNHKPTWGNPETFAIGLNWSIKTNFDGKTKIWTSGGTFGQSCYICLYPGRKFGIVILTNESDGQVEDQLSDMAQTSYNQIFFTADQRASEGFGFSASINKLLDSLNKYGFENSIKLADDLMQNDKMFKLSEDEVNLWGYSYFFKKQKVKALEIFKLNVGLYPKSANTYDSLAETYEDMGDKASAIKNYKLELEINPGNKDIADHLSKLIENNK